MKPFIELDGVSRWYGQVIGLNDVSLRIGTGVTGLLGPNGAGKSTLIRLVTGQIAASMGTVHVFGAPVFRRPRMLSRIGCCPDIERFQDDWTGFQFVRAAAYLGGFDFAAAGRRAAELLETMGLAAAAHKVIGSYSKGMRQRVKLAQSLVNDPELLVLDEPLTGMDPLGRRQLIEQVRSWGREGRCVLVSSHVLHEVEAMTDEVILLHHGRVLAEGRVHDIRSLLSGTAHHVTIEVAQPRRLATSLVDRVDLVGLRFDTPQSVTVETSHPDDLFTALERLVLEDGVEVRRLYTRDDSLEAVFDYLVH